MAALFCISPAAVCMWITKGIPHKRCRKLAIIADELHRPDMTIEVLLDSFPAARKSRKPYSRRTEGSRAA